MEKFLPLLPSEVFGNDPSCLKIFHVSREARLQEDVLMMPKKRASRVLFNPINPRYMIKKTSRIFLVENGSWKWKLLEVGSWKWKLLEVES